MPIVVTERFAEVAERHNTLRARKAELGTALDRARQEAHEGELAGVSAEKDLAKTSHDIDRATARRRSLEAELSDIEGVLRTAEHDELAVNEELDTARTQLEHLHHGLAKSEVRAISWRERVAAQAALLTERKVRSDVGMTGEITLRGQVLPVGGIKMKVLAAHQAGLKTVILPRQNEKDLDDVPDDVQDALEFILTERVDDVFAAALLPDGATP